jgi:hypothetical protein
VDGTILQEKSLKLAATMETENFLALNGWISCFEQWHGLVFKKLAGYSAAVDATAMDLWFERLPELLKGYEAQDIYNANEQASFQLPPTPNTDTERRDPPWRKKCEGVTHGATVHKQRWLRQTILIVTEKSAKLWCLKKVKKLPVTHYGNSKAWMRLEIFRDFLHALDASFGAQGRKILLCR